MHILIKHCHTNIEGSSKQNNEIVNEFFKKALKVYRSKREKKKKEEILSKHQRKRKV